MDELQFAQNALIGIGIVCAILLVLFFGRVVSAQKRQYYAQPGIRKANEGGSCSGGLCIATRENTVTGSYRDTYESNWMAERKEMVGEKAEEGDGTNYPLVQRTKESASWSHGSDEYPVEVELTPTGPAVIHVRIGRG